VTAIVFIDIILSLSLESFVYADESTGDMVARLVTEPPRSEQRKFFDA
jgi:hypothetical protein